MALFSFSLMVLSFLRSWRVDDLGVRTKNRITILARLAVEFFGALDPVCDGFQQFVDAVAVGQCDRDGFGFLQLSEDFRFQFSQRFWLSHNRKSANKSEQATATAAPVLGRSL